MQKLEITSQDVWALTNRTLKILIPKDIADQAEELIKSTLPRLQAGNIVTKLDETQWAAEIRRLAGIAQRITQDFPNKLDIFEFLPLTKNGKFPGNQNILIADSKCVTGTNEKYPVRQSIQVRLMPYWASLEDFANDKKQKDTRILELHWFDSLRKTTPIFDENNIPTKPVTVKTEYLDDSKIKPGHVYEEKTGCQYLVLDGIRFQAELDTHGYPYTTPEHVAGYTCHVYIRWTKTLKTAMGTANDINTLMHIMAENDKDTPWTYTSKLSARQSPRKFVRHVRKALDLSKTKSEKFEKPCQNGNGTLRYYIEPDESKTKKGA